MKLQRFIGDFELTNDRIVSNDKKLIDQLRKVFRFVEGDTVNLCDGMGNEVQALIDVLAKDQVIFSVTKRLEAKKLESKNVHLFQAIIKKENFETVVQKATECGVAEIIPIITERTVKLSLNFERLFAIAKEASEQSGRTFLPHLSQSISFESALENKNDHLKIILDPTAEQSLGDLVSNSDSIDILIGPEGGFSPREVNLAEIAGFKRASLGNLTLRAETAGIVASYLAVHPVRSLN